MSCVIRPIDALDELCAQLTRDLFAIAKFLPAPISNESTNIYRMVPKVRPLSVHNFKTIEMNLHNFSYYHSIQLAFLLL